MRGSASLCNPNMLLHLKGAIIFFPSFISCRCYLYWIKIISSFAVKNFTTGLLYNWTWLQLLSTAEFSHCNAMCLFSRHCFLKFTSAIKGSTTWNRRRSQTVSKMQQSLLVSRFSNSGLHSYIYKCLKFLWLIYFTILQMNYSKKTNWLSLQKHSCWVWN